MEDRWQEGVQNRAHVSVASCCIASVKEHMSSRQTEAVPTCHQDARRRCHQDAEHQPPRDPASLSAEQRPEPCDPRLCPPGPCLGSLPCLGCPQKTAIQSRIPVLIHSCLVEVHGRNSEASMLCRQHRCQGPLGRLCYCPEHSMHLVLPVGRLC